VLTLGWVPLYRRPPPGSDRFGPDRAEDVAAGPGRVVGLTPAEGAEADPGRSVAEVTRLDDVGVACRAWLSDVLSDNHTADVRGLARTHRDVFLQVNDAVPRAVIAPRKLLRDEEVALAGRAGLRDGLASDAIARPLTSTLTTTRCRRAGRARTTPDR